MIQRVSDCVQWDGLRWTCLFKWIMENFSSRWVSSDQTFIARRRLFLRSNWFYLSKRWVKIPFWLLQILWVCLVRESSGQNQQCFALYYGHESDKFNCQFNRDFMVITKIMTRVELKGEFSLFADTRVHDKMHGNVWCEKMQKPRAQRVDRCIIGERSKKLNSSPTFLSVLIFQFEGKMWHNRDLWLHVVESVPLGLNWEVSFRLLIARR